MHNLDYTTAMQGLDLKHRICTQVSLWGGDTLTVFMYIHPVTGAGGGAKYGRVAEETDEL